MRGFCAAAAVSLFLLGPQQPRDAAPQPATGTATLSGVLVTDDTASAPIRRARVTLNSSSPLVRQTTITDDAGRFAFVSLPAGNYLLGAAKIGSVATNYGAKRPGRAGTAIVLTDGQRLTNVVMRMLRGAVIAGTVLDPNGDPAADTVVSVRPVGIANVERIFMLGVGDARTDDRGAYRVYGLAPGEYTVSAAPPIGPRNTIRPITNADIARAQGRSGVGAIGPTPPQEVRTVGLVPIYYPGTASASNAAPVRLSAGEERTGVDLRLEFVPTVKIEGTVSRADGPIPGSVQVTLTPSTAQTTSRVLTDGAFTISGVAPGQYVVTAEVRGGAGRGAAPAPTAPQQAWWASADVTVDGRDVAGVRLALLPEPTVSGRFVFEGAAPKPTDPARAIVDFFDAKTGNLFTRPKTAADGTFVATAVRPGPYRVRGLWPTASGPTPWTFKSATIGGRDVSDIPVELRAGVDVSELIVTFTDQQTELTGTLQDEAGRAARDYFIVVFCADRALWVPQSRWIAQTRPSSDGTFAVKGLPPGEYRIAALTDVEPNEWYDPAFLEPLVPSAIAITLHEGEKKVQDLKIRGTGLFSTDSAGRGTGLSLRDLSPFGPNLWKTDPSPYCELAMLVQSRMDTTPRRRSFALPALTT